eukprot:gene19321-25184_t
MSELNTDNSVSDDNILNNQVQSVQQNNSYVSSSEDLNIPYNIFDSSDVMDTVDNNNIEFPNNIFLSWGRNDSGTLFRSEEEIIDGVQSLKFFGNRNIISISSNCYHSGAVTATGELYLCGSNEEGQSNPNRDNNGQLQPFVPKPRIIESLGHAITFGGNEVGQLGHSSNQTSQVAPKLVDFKWKGKGSIAHKVSCGDMYSLFLATSGEIYSCGVGANTGHSNDTNLFHAERIETLVGVNVVYIVAGSSHSFAIASTGELYGWGSSQSGQLGMGDDSSLHYQIPIKIPLPANIGKVVGVSAGYSHSLIWVEKGSIHGCGSNKSGQVGLYLPKVSTFTEIPLHGVCLMAACGSNHSIAVIQENNNSKIYGWGSNIHGQITSTSTVTIYRQPTELTEFVSQWNINNVFYISAGGDQSYLIGSHNNQYFSNPNEFEFKMKKQFSTQASRAVVAMDASSLTKLINRAQLISESQGISHIELSSVLSITCELFSSPSLLAGSFINNQTALLLDINGIEECYKSLLSLGSTAIVRLNSAMLQALNELESNHLNLPESALRILIIFDGEEGIDEGGVSKEFFQLLFHQLLSFDYGMFVHTPDQRNLWINKLCTWCEDEYQLIVLEDVISYDQELYNGLKLLQEYEPKEDVESVFCRTFEVTYDEFGEEKRFDLIPNGSNISVTHENRELYIEKYVTWLLIDSIIRPDELETLMIGTPHLDFYELENATTYISGDENNSVPWDKNNPIIKGFWEIVHNMAFEDKQKLLLFITGSTKAPIGGLKNLGMKIQRMCGDSISLPTSHTCFNVLLLPEYSSKDKLNDRLYKAISECEGFGLK